MKAVWLTDIHLNFLEDDRLENFLRVLSKEIADCLFISGDIGEANSIVNYLERMESALKKQVYFVLGNHDYYGGSIEEVRSNVFALTKNSDNLIWLNKAGVVSLTTETALIGHDSWADARFGDFYSSNVELNDFYLIKELKLRERIERLKAMQKLADEAAKHFFEVLPSALETHRQIIVLTHVPPFREASWHEGKISGDDWLPFFSCKVVGDVLKEIMKQHSSCEMTVLCGHCHSSGECQVLPNLRVLTGRAEYGSPEVQRIFEIR